MDAIIDSDAAKIRLAELLDQGEVLAALDALRARIAARGGAVTWDALREDRSAGRR